MSRRRSTRATSSAVVDPNADPDFLALTARQQRLIDRVFDKATRPTGPARKKRKVILELTPPHSGPPIDNDFGEGGFEDEGGFMDAGGFVPDEGGGGFMSDGDGGGGGGFISDGEEVRAHDDQVGSLDEFGGGGGEPRRIPLRTLPAILSSLNLPSDEDVLAVFRASASGWTEPDRRRDRNNEEQEEAMLMGGGVELKDFRAVCAALMGPDEGGEGEGEGDDQLSSGDDEDEDTYKVGDGDGGEDSSLSEITEDEYKDRESTTKPPASKKGKGRGRKKKLELEDNGRIKLNPRQREVVNDLWGMLKPEGEREVRGGHVLGRDEVRRKVRDLGEMWTEDEITEMVTLFSTQYQGRGLSYDDFGAIMVRAGLA